MFPFTKKDGAPETTPETPTPTAADPAPQTPERRDRTADIRARAEAHADGVMRGRTEFHRQQVRNALISAFISGADFTGGEATEQPAPAAERPELTQDELAQREQDECDAETLEQEEQQAGEH